MLGRRISMELAGSLSVNGQDADVLQFLDSMDDFLFLQDSLSLTLRQGWLDLAIARHSMGSARVTAMVLDLNPHPAAIKLVVNQSNDELDDEMVQQPHFMLPKEASLNQGIEDSKEMPEKSDYFQEGKKSEDSSDSEANSTEDAQLRKHRSKSLSIFSPRLQAAQVSFERGKKRELLDA
ncbi:uncharacterized protein LOC18445517 [Amborella trichopoda]|uniref:uncharacterized protein LOC18445517 n=1 Tax=Amborella trichopoda TaxID=13333 RepID=UPI0005D30087|nr:uncharacterized protein LOC18445517 [Amborella trichopoda]|eukprot:XP_006855716.2 uncharacterized protein LOC18445517 [Amborella trichopoda]